MKLRFNISTLVDTGSPDYTICGQASTFLPSAVSIYNNLSLLLKIDGTTIINTADLTTFNGTLPQSAIVTTNGYNVTVALENTYYLVIGIDMVNIWDITTAEFSIGKTGYWSYNKIFEIFGYDLGVNPNVVATAGNPEFNLYLINKTNNEVNGVQTKAYASFIYYRRPFTSELYIYKSNSGGGEVIYTDSDLVTLNIAVDGFICVAGDYSIKQTNNIYTYDNTGRVLISTCSTDFLLSTNVVAFPTFGGSTTCTTCDNECIVINTENTTTTNIDYSLLTTYMVDDTEVNPYTTQVLTYRVIDFTGNIIQEEEHTFDINPLPFTYDQTSYKFVDFVIPEIGDYIIQVELSVAGLYSCKKNYPVKGCSFYEIKNTNCNEFTIYNRGFDDFDVVISELQDDKTFLEVSTVTVPTLDNIVISHTTDNVYQYKVTKDDVDYIYIVVNYCNLRNCILLGVTNLMCQKTSDCTDCKAKDYYDFNVLITMAHTYFNMLNSEYNFNYLYESLDVNKLNELYELKTFLTRFEEYCIECNKVCSNCG